VAALGNRPLRSPLWVLFTANSGASFMRGPVACRVAPKYKRGMVADTPDLAFLARQMDRMFMEMGSFRDEQRVQGALLRRLDIKVSSLSDEMRVMSDEMRAMRDQIIRMNDRISRLEDARA
jgi:hypothetical protein